MPRINKGPRLEPRTDGVWEIRYTETVEAGGRGRSRRYSTGTTDRQRALAVFGEWLKEQQQPAQATRPGQPRAVAPDAWTVRAVMERYYNVHGRTVKSSEAIERCMANLIALMGDKRLVDMRIDDTIDYRAARESGDGAVARQPAEQRAQRGRPVYPAAPGTVRQELICFLTACNHVADTLREMDKALVPPVKLPPVPKPRTAYLTWEELDVVFATAEQMRRERAAKLRLDPEEPTRAELWCHIAASTGARRASIENLEWKNVDMDRRVIDTRPFYTTDVKRGAQIPISDELLPLLEAERARYPTGRYVLRKTTEVLNDVVILLTKAGLPDEKRIPHIFRHTYASLALQAGVSIDKVAYILGDKVATVERVYGHMVPEAARDAVNIRHLRPAKPVAKPKLRVVA